MKITTSQWVAVIGLAAGLHLLVAIAYAGWNLRGALGEGEHGIEIGLGILGDSGDSIDSAQAVAEPTPEESLPPEPEPILQIPQVPEFQPENITWAASMEQSIPRQEIGKPSLDLALYRTNWSSTDVVAGNYSTSGQRSSGSGQTESMGGTTGKKVSYVDRLLSRLNRHKQYPTASRRDSEEGTVILYLHLRRDGSLVETYVQTGSGFPNLDEAALQMVDRANPLPPFPDSELASSMQLNIPVEFELVQFR